jgi:hypothetical protein
VNDAHTPGPWRLDDPLHSGVLTESYHSIDAGVGYHLEGRSRNAGFGLLGLMSTADARLIAAAPDLLEELKSMCDVWSSMCSVRGWEPNHLAQYTIARAAIAKATEEQP